MKSKICWYCECDLSEPDTERWITRQYGHGYREDPCPACNDSNGKMLPTKEFIDKHLAPIKEIFSNVPVSQKDVILEMVKESLFGSK